MRKNPALLLGYNTNGFAHHGLDQALTILADLGYQSVAITLDYHALNPYQNDCAREVVRVRQLLERLRLSAVVETGARFLLDPPRKHQPTLISHHALERKQRLEFLKRAVDIAQGIQAGVVSFWSGAPVNALTPAIHMERLVEGCRELCFYAGSKDVRLAFEPEPGMFIDTMLQFQELHDRVNHPVFGLTLDIGHVHCVGDDPIADQLRRWRERLWNIHIEDMRRGVHEHLMFGEGEIDFGPVMKTLKEIGYDGGVHVELSRHSHDAVNAARRAITFLKAALA